MTIKDIKYTIITPVYNRADCIGKCIESVVVQDYPHLEMWIVDDGSVDETSVVIESYQKQYDFIKYHKFESNKGVNAARNYGIANSESDFLIFLDSDDVFVEGALERVSSCIAKEPGYSHFLFMQDDRISQYEEFHLMDNPTVGLAYSDFLLNKVYGDFVHVMKTDVVQRFPFPEHLRIYEGLNFLKIFKENEKLLFCRELVSNRDRGRFDSVTKDYRLNNIDAIRKKYETLKTQIIFFKSDYYKYDSTGCLVSFSLAKDAYLLGVASSDYDLLFVDDFLNNWDRKVPFLFKTMRSLRLGVFLRTSMFMFSSLKTIFRKN